MNKRAAQVLIIVAALSTIAWLSHAGVTGWLGLVLGAAVALLIEGARQLAERLEA